MDCGLKFPKKPIFSGPMKYVLILFFSLVGLCTHPLYAQNIFDVNSLSDGPDAVPGDGICFSVNGLCSLRAAIEEANASPNTNGLDRIHFSSVPAIIGSAALINITSPYLPEITDPVIIDGTTTQAEVIINGEFATNPSSSESGITILQGGQGSTIKGLTICNFNFSGIHINDSQNNSILRNYLGTLVDGTACGNRHGIWIYGDNNRIGGKGPGFDFTLLGNGNVIGHNDRGISISTTDHITIQRNFIGTDPAGRNLGNEIGISASSTEYSVIGGPTPKHGNTIGYNELIGIWMSGGSNNKIRNNYIGTNGRGENLGNGTSGTYVHESGLFLDQSHDNIIGGGQRYRNVIGHNGDGIKLVRANSNLIRGNLIGIHGDSSDIGNLGNGIHQISGNHNVIGYGVGEEIVTPALRSNQITNNQGSGIVINEEFGRTSFFNTIRGNSIYENGGLGIDLLDDGISENDSTDHDGGPNYLQNTPDISRLFIDETPTVKLVMRYTIHSDSTTVPYPLTVDFYFVDDPASGEGKTYLGTDIYTQQDSLDKIAVDTTGLFLDENDVFVATATDADGNTSEFSLPTDILGPLSLSGPSSFKNQYNINSDLKTTIYPNPFNPSATINIELPIADDVRISVFDLVGRQVASLYEGKLDENHRYTFQLDGSMLSSGVYLLRIEGTYFIRTLRLTLLK